MPIKWLLLTKSCSIVFWVIFKTCKNVEQNCFFLFTFKTKIKQSKEKIKVCDENNDFGERNKKPLARPHKTTDINLKPRLICYIIRSRRSRIQTMLTESTILTTKKKPSKQTHDEKSFVQLTRYMCHWIFLFLGDSTIAVKYKAICHQHFYTMLEFRLQSHNERWREKCMKF